MSLWETLAATQTAGGDEIILRKRGSIFEIRFNGIELMSSVNHHSEDDLAVSSIARCSAPPKRILIGGLGLGYTLRAVLDQVAPDVKVTVCEIIPEVIEWNRGVLSHLAGAPLSDPRVDVVCGCVLQHMQSVPRHYDLILLDTDNGPELLVRPDNAAIYHPSGIETVANALGETGHAAFWSATADPQFERALTAMPWRWSRQDISVLPGRHDAMHHIYSCDLERVEFLSELMYF
jgi:spermidine synthase